MTLASAMLSPALQAETCTTQSQMAAADRTALTAVAQSFAVRVKSNDAAGVKAGTIPQYAENFDGIAAAISATEPKITGDVLSVTGLYILDASSNIGTKDTQFFCSLNNSASEAIFSLPALPPGRYALATVRAQGIQPAWNLSFVLRQSGSAWQLAGFIPKPATAAGHDGLWYWTQARTFAKQAQRWNAWLYYSEADALLSPVDFVSSTNRDKLHAEQTETMPQPLQLNGISADHPLTLPEGTAAVPVPAQSFAFTAIGTQESLDGKSLELAVHITASDVSKPADVRARSMQALNVLLAAYPELHNAFAAAWVYADAPGQSSFGIEFNPLPVQ
jgi:hypothetical protein